MSTRRVHTPGQRSLAQDAGELHRAVSNLVRIYQFRDRKSICYYDVTVTQCYALSTIVARGSLTQNELAADLYLDKATTSRVIAELARKGYVRRATDPGDGRVRNVEATAKGHGLHDRIERDLVEQMQSLITDQKPATRRATIDLITRLADAAADRFGGPQPACAKKD